jgi:hypothetical protein
MTTVTSIVSTPESWDPAFVVLRGSESSEVVTIPYMADTEGLGDVARTGCPHQQPGLSPWNSSATWGQAVPEPGADVVLPVGVSVLLSGVLETGFITVPATSALIIDDMSTSLSTRGIYVQSGGSLLAGSPTCRLEANVQITLEGSANDQFRPPWHKGIFVTGTLDLHGHLHRVTWSRLAATAEAGDNRILLQDDVDWEVGQKNCSHHDGGERLP